MFDETFSVGRSFWMPPECDVLLMGEPGDPFRVWCAVWGFLRWVNQGCGWLEVAHVDREEGVVTYRSGGGL